MLDQIEYDIAKRLSDHYNYPYARDIYINIFKKFSHFPINLSDTGIDSKGQTATLLALVIYTCFTHKKKSFMELFQSVLQDLESKVAPHYPQSIVVETFLGCILYFYHPVDIRNAISTMELTVIFNGSELHEYSIKKNTILLFAV